MQSDPTRKMIVLVASALACTDDPKKYPAPKYELQVTPTAIEVAIGAESESPVNLVATFAYSSSALTDYPEAHLEFFSSDPKIATLGTFRPTEGFRRIFQSGARFEYILSERDVATLTVACHKSGSAHLQITGEAKVSEEQGAVEAYQRVPATTGFDVTCKGELPDLVVVIDSVTDATRGVVVKENGDDVVQYGRATINFTVTNKGKGDAGRFRVSAWADLGNAPAPKTGAGPFVDGLAAGASFSGSVVDDRVGTDVTEGAWAYVDSFEEVAESDETNNIAGPYSW